MNNTSGNSLAADNFVTYSEDALLGQSRTDWERLDALSEDEIDTSDIPPLTEEELARMQWRVSTHRSQSEQTASLEETTRLRKARLAQECAKLDPAEEQAMAEEFLKR